MAGQRRPMIVRGGRGGQLGRRRRWEVAIGELREQATAQRLGRAHPDLDASLAAHAVVGALSDHLWQRTRPTRDEIDHIVEFCLGGPRTAR